MGYWVDIMSGVVLDVADALIIKDAITRQLGIPVLLLECEGFDPRVYNEEQYRRKIELFKEVLIHSRQRQ